MRVGHQLGLWIAVGAAAATAAAQQASTESYNDVSSVEGAIAENLARIEHAQARQAQIDTEVHGLASKREASQERLQGRARALYRVRRAGMLPVAGGFDALLRHLARVQRLSRMVKSDLETMRFLEERGRALEAEKSVLEVALKEADEALKALEARKRQLERARRASANHRRSSRGRQGDTRENLAYGQIRVSDAEAELETGFAEMRGQLALPLQGGFRYQAAERGGAQGLEFFGRSGASVRAAADGRVAFARDYGAYGPMVVIDHGDSFYTVYGGLDRWEVEVGDWVGMSARIGMLDRGDPKAVLFFEVRKGTKPLDARSWLGL